MAVKTPKQMAKKQYNITLATKRFEALRAKQAKANEFRKLGIIGLNDDEVIANGQAYAFQQEELRRAAWIKAVLNLKDTGTIIRKWLSVRLNQRTQWQIEQLILNFINRPGNERFKVAVDTVNAVPLKLAA
jgi:hypothetical protein